MSYFAEEHRTTRECLQGRSVLSGLIVRCASANGRALVPTIWKARKDFQEGQKPFQRSLVVCSLPPLRIEKAEYHEADFKWDWAKLFRLLVH